MNAFNFIGYPTTMVPFDENFIAYDEGRYPDPKTKTTVRSHKSNSRCIDLLSQSEQAVAFTCRKLVTHSQHQ
jgi:hypothetical protein